MVLLNLERVAFDLTEVGMNRRIERDIGRDPVLGIQPQVTCPGGIVPAVRRGARLIDRKCHTGQQLNQLSLLEFIEDEVRVSVEHPEPRRQIRP